MSNGAEEYSDIELGVRDTLSLYALILNVNETIGLARRRNDEHITAMRNAQRAHFQRFVIFDPPSSEKPLTDLAVAMPNDRIVLRFVPTAESSKQARDIIRLIIRVPYSKDEVIDDGTPQETFLEFLHSDGARERYLLNSEGLSPYDDASQIINHSGGHFSVQGPGPSADGEEMERFSRLIAENTGFEFQTNFDPEW